MQCKECGKSLLSRQEELNHYHLVMTVSAEAGVYLIHLPDGCSPGRWEAAESFAEAFLELRKKAPGRVFTFTPFDHERGGEFVGVKAWLAVTQSMNLEG